LSADVSRQRAVYVAKYSSPRHCGWPRGNRRSADRLNAGVGEQRGHDRDDGASGRIARRRQSLAPRGCSPRHRPSRPSRVAFGLMSAGSGEPVTRSTAASRFSVTKIRAMASGAVPWTQCSTAGAARRRGRPERTRGGRAAGCTGARNRTPSAAHESGGVRVDARREEIREECREQQQNARGLEQSQERSQVQQESV
jgi:hypothetical protein